MTPTFLQQIPPTTFLPLWAQILLLIFVGIALFFQWRHSIAISEFSVVKQAVERLRNENRELVTENATLKTKQDLTPLLESFKAFQTDLEKWKVEARGQYTGALQRLEQIRAENIQGIKSAQDVLQGIAESLTELKKKTA